MSFNMLVIHKTKTYSPLGNLIILVVLVFVIDFQSLDCFDTTGFHYFFTFDGTTDKSNEELQALALRYLDAVILEIEEREHLMLMVLDVQRKKYLSSYDKHWRTIVVLVLMGWNHKHMIG